MVKWHCLPGVGMVGVGWKRLGRTQRTVRTVNILCTLLYWWVHAIIHLANLVECATPGMNPKVNCGLWAVMMCQLRFVGYSKCATLGMDATDGGGGLCMSEDRGHMGVSTPFSPFF